MVCPFVFYASGRPLSAYVRWSLSVLLVLGGSLGPGMRDRCLGRGGVPRPRTMLPLPPTETRIVSFLKDQIALSSSRTFRGRVATMEMLNVEGEVD